MLEQLDQIHLPRVRRIRKATAYKPALWEIQYAPGVFTNVYNADRDQVVALARRLAAI